jgi:large subunit ribosomal protein L37Ae
MPRTRKVKSVGRYGVRYGVSVKERVKAVELKQRAKQVCPFCKKGKVKRLSTGIWQCYKCSKKFASDAYYLP